MKEIPLTQGQVALVDDADYDWLNQWKWQAGTKDNQSWYATRPIGPSWRRRSIPMHREIIKAPDSLFVDHINGNGLDNRRSNLRLCTNAQNQHNRKVSKNNRLGFKGVVFHKAGRGTYEARIMVNLKRVHLGRYNTPEEAARAYDAAAEKYYGEFAKLNFPEEK